MWGNVSLGLGVICLAVAIPLWVFHPGDRRHLWFQLLIVSLVLTGWAGVMTSIVGDWVRWGTGWVDSGLSSLVARLGIAVPAALGIVGIVLLIYVIGKIRHKSVDEKTLLATAGLSVSAGAIPGAVGVFAVMVLGFPVHLIAGLISAGFGI